MRGNGQAKEKEVDQELKTDSGEEEEETGQRKAIEENMKNKTPVNLDEEEK